MIEKKLILFDLDGCLCKGVSWTPDDCLKADVDKDVAEKLLDLYHRNFIIIYTARRDELIPATLQWLRTNNIRYHAFSNQKISADIYIDDLCVNVKDL